MGGYEEYRLGSLQGTMIDYDESCVETVYESCVVGNVKLCEVYIYL